MEQIEDDMSTVAGTIAKPVVTFFLPKGWDWLMNKIFGKKLLIVGPGRTGKTSFKNYLIKGILLKENDTPKTGLHSSSKGRVVSINNGSTELSIKSLTDSPGQIGSIVQAQSVIDYKPHFLFIFLNCEEIEQSLSWFEDFCECLLPKFRDDPSLSEQVNAIIIVMNKYDKIAGESIKDKKDILDSFKIKIKKIAMEELKQVYFRAGEEAKTPIILPAICVKNNGASDLLEDIINTMASKI
jgi:GTPase SAR1 family protein